VKDGDKVRVRGQYPKGETGRIKRIMHGEYAIVDLDKKRHFPTMYKLSDLQEVTR
jgi:hypothetical protein